MIKHTSKVMTQNWTATTENSFIPMSQEGTLRSMKDTGDMHHFLHQDSNVYHEYAPQGQNAKQHFYF